MLEYLIKANVLGMILFFIPAFYIFIRNNTPVENELVERKLYLACGAGAIFGSIAEAMILAGGLKSYSENMILSYIIFLKFITTLNYYLKIMR